MGGRTLSERAEISLLDNDVLRLHVYGNHIIPQGDHRALDLAMVAYSLPKPNFVCYPNNCCNKTDLSCFY